MTEYQVYCEPELDGVPGRLSGTLRTDWIFRGGESIYDCGFGPYHNVERVVITTTGEVHLETEEFTHDSSGDWWVSNSSLWENWEPYE